ncbi:MAG: hypothetical protein PHC51_13735 [bacterium]|nr:hypothetical protein [bacterium]
MRFSPLLSIVIPTLAADRSWITLLYDLLDLELDFEVIVVCPDISRLRSILREEIKLIEKGIDLYTTRKSPPNTDNSPTVIRLLESEQGRAKQMNAGAIEARGEFVLFLHGDSRLSKTALNSLAAALQTKCYPENRLLYYCLKFANDGPPLMKLNEWGVRFRSSFFKLPFGDQGFCLKLQTFLNLGGFNETAACAEDLLFVIAARKAEIELRSLPETIITSARKYRRYGWLKTTAHHLLVTLSLTLREWFLLHKEQNLLPEEL